MGSGIVKKLAVSFADLRKFSSPPSKGDKLDDKDDENAEKTQR